MSLRNSSIDDLHQNFLKNTSLKGDIDFDQSATALYLGRPIRFRHAEKKSAQVHFIRRTASLLHSFDFWGIVGEFDLIGGRLILFDESIAIQ